MLVRPLPLLNSFVALVMLSIGLRVSGGQLLDTLRNRPLFIRTLLANCVLIPGIGVLLVKLFPLTPDASVGILLLAAIPGTPIALQFTRMAKPAIAAFPSSVKSTSRKHPCDGVASRLFLR
jgi:predicted Na+-dependent transporter